MKGRLGDATKVLNKTSNSKQEAQLRLAEIKQAAGIPEECTDNVVEVKIKNTGEGIWKEIFLYPTPTIRYIVIAALDCYDLRPMLLTSVGGMIVSLLTLATSLTIIDHSPTKKNWAVGLNIATVLSYVATFSIGAGPIKWVYCSEIFPFEVKGTRLCYGSCGE
ncbi:hypothetical protein TSUD_89790 [Trifolium subterraneum]|uniref:Major facilitator superfamily (MFS) profile domain-containing protein n=1 Tax=Trifolium subterraneum TaxID=3900 RepID=A0A2Z6NGT4_TRISU|nr:hypothetical protein TSUD_89790 [Trifolium subterraneum]